MINIENPIDCCGCSACAQICPKQCIDLKEDLEGFLYPVVDNDVCVNCNLCEKVCAVKKTGKARTPIEVFAVKNLSDYERLESSSGGVFTLLAKQTIHNGGVVFGACFGKNWEVIHDYADSLEGINAFRGSKYVQSRIGDSYERAKQFLKTGRQVLFSGTPCQIAGLVSYLDTEYENLVTVDLICHGVPSPKVWRMYLDELVLRKKRNRSYNTNDNETIKEIRFRDKTFGWKHFGFSLTFSDISNTNINPSTFYEPLNKNVYLKGFFLDLYLRPICHSCPFKSLKSNSDITLGDYWGIDDYYPAYDDDKGVSAVIVNSSKGIKAFGYLKKDYIESSYAIVLKTHKSIAESPRSHKNRNCFFRTIQKEKNIIAQIEKYATRDVKAIAFAFLSGVSHKIGLHKIIKRIRKWKKRR